MLPGARTLPDGLALRPAGPADQPFIEALFAATRPHLQLIDGEQEYVQSIVDMQIKAQTMSYGEQFPNAMYFVVEKLNERIGRVSIDFDSNRVHIIDIAFIPTAQGKGYGTSVISAIQQTAARIKAPVTLAVAKDQPQVKQLYLKLGFRVEDSISMYERMIWFPDAKAMRGI